MTASRLAIAIYATVIVAIVMPLNRRLSARVPDDRASRLARWKRSLPKLYRGALEGVCATVAGAGWHGFVTHQWPRLVERFGVVTASALAIGVAGVGASMGRALVDTEFQFLSEP